MFDFTYDTPTTVYFGKGIVKRTGEIVNSFKPGKVLIHYGSAHAKKSGLINLIEKQLDEFNISYIELGGVKANPELSLVREGISLCQKEKVDFILAVGGGSVLDSAKDIANGVANPENDVWDFTMKKAVPVNTLKKGAVLTIAAAGSEMSDSCVITNTDISVKGGYNCHANRMDFAIEDPELTLSVDKYQTACGAVDIALHTIERYFSVGDGDLTDAISEAVITTTFKAGLKALENPEDYDARAELMWASSVAHNGLTGCGRLVQLEVHQFGHELSGMHPEIAHGAALSSVWASHARFVYSSNIQRWLRYSEKIWNLKRNDFASDDDMILEAIKLQEDMYRKMGMPVSIREFGIPEAEIEELAERCSKNKTRVIGGYKKLGYDEMLAIYKAAY